MPLKFETVDDVLTDEHREELMDDHRKGRDRIKEVVMDLLDIALNDRYDYRKDVQIFDNVAEINDALNAMADVMYEYDTSYSLLLEKYNEAIKAAE